MEVGWTSQQVESAKKLEVDYLAAVKTEQAIIDKEGRTQVIDNSKNLEECNFTMGQLQLTLYKTLRNLMKKNPHY